MYLDRRLWDMTAGLRGRIALAAGVGLLGLPVGLARLALLGLLIAAVFRARPFADVVPLVIAVALLTVVRAVVQFAKEEIANRTAAEIKVRLRTQIYRKVLDLGPGYFDQRRTGTVLLSLVDGVEMLETFFGLYLPQLVVAALTPLFIFAFMAFLDLPTALIFLVFAVFTLVAPGLFHRWNAKSSMSRRDAWAAMGSDFIDAIQGLVTLKLFGRSRDHGAQLAQRARQLYRSTMYVLAVNIVTGGVAVFGISAGAAIALGWGAVRVSQGALDLSVLMIVLMLGVEVFRPIRELTSLYHRGMLAQSATTGIYGILDARPDVSEASAARHIEHVAPKLAFEGVTFAYPGRPRPALESVSFQVPAGKTVAVVGPSGAGKSTLVWLLERFYDPDHGRVTIGGHDLRTLSFDTIRRNLAVVSQDTYLFHGSVAENLRLGRPDASDAELEAAARGANAHDFIMALPNGYATVVGERGARLSGGQRQRIAIARALLVDAPILVLDEALSSVDTENESLIQQALERLQAGRTTLVIAHRLSSVVSADQILVLADGHIAESGTHEALLARHGLYWRLTRAQRDDDDTAEPDVTLSEEPSTPTNGTTAAAVTSATSSSSPLAAVSAARQSSLGIWGRLFGLVRPWARDQIVVFLLGLLHATAVIGLGVIGALLVRQAATGADITAWLWVLGITVMLAAFLTWAESWLAHDLAYRLLAEMRIDLFEKLDPLAPAYLLRRRTGDLVSAVSSDIEQVEYFFAHTTAPACIAVLVPAGVLVVLATLHPMLALVLVPFLLGVGWSPFLSRRVAERLGSQARGQLGEVNAHVVDSVQGLRVLTMFRRGEARLREIEDNSRALAHFQIGFMRNQATLSGVIEALTGLGGLAVATTSAVLVTRGEMAAGYVPLATVLALSSFGPVTDVAKVVKQLADTLAAVRRVFAVHDEPVTVRDGSQPLKLTGDRSPRIELRDVSFRYGPGEPEVLRRVSFSIAPGQTVALVGRSGAGKTTVANLLPRFWDPLDGAVLVDGVDVRTVPLDSLRQCAAAVSQDTYLFNTTIRHNLTLGQPHATDQEMDEAVRLANLLDFVRSLPDGYDTVIGERGMQLSGGQRQRLAIARAILKNAPVLILDEATSHLDAENERQVRAALDRLMRNRTTLVIAHRLSTIKRADQIVVLEDGHVAEQGTHTELLARGGPYSRLVAAQTSRDVSPAAAG
ncbi:MAG: thiol reductant ABC exporter subunit CydC [Chloroflexota bacterium]